MITRALIYFDERYAAGMPPRQFMTLTKLVADAQEAQRRAT